MNQPTKYYGLWIYNYLPKGMRVATIEDYLEDGRFRIGLKFLVKCANTDEYEAHEMGYNTMGKFINHIMAGLTYIKP